MDHKVIQTKLFPFASSDPNRTPIGVYYCPAGPEWRVLHGNLLEVNSEHGDLCNHVDEDDYFHCHDSEVVAAIEDPIPSQECIQFTPMRDERPHEGG